jgi:single stranded DNA-binding protein
VALNLNHVTLSGNLTRDPRLEILPCGHVVCELHVACHYRERDANSGAWRKHTDYIPVRAFAHQARTAHEHLRRGSPVAIVGRVCSRKLSARSAGAWRVEVIAQTVQFLGAGAPARTPAGRQATRSVRHDAA